MSKSKISSPTVKYKAYIVERDGAGFSLFEVMIEDDKVVSKKIVHHQDMLSITIEKLRQELRNDFK